MVTTEVCTAMKHFPFKWRIAMRSGTFAAVLNYKGIYG